MLHLSGIDTSRYAADSCHSASSSKAKVSGKAGIPLYNSTTRILCDLLMLQLSSLHPCIRGGWGQHLTTVTFFPFQVTG